MRGKVIKYFDDKGYGFIKDEEGHNRFFHITKVKNHTISVGNVVKFDPERTDKGLACVNITVLNDRRPTFIAFGDTRVKLSNNKSYGVDYETIEEVISEKEIQLSKGQRVGNRITGTVLGVIGAAASGPAGMVEMARKVSWGKSYTEVETGDVEYKILYVTTYQGDNFRFHEKHVDFDVQKKIDQLDTYFCD